MALRNLLIAVLAAAALWAGYWVYGAGARERGTADWLTERRSDGWIADWAEIRVAGFPNRFDLTVVDLRLADPDTGIGLRTPFVQVLSLAYAPRHLIVVLPPSFRLDTGPEVVEVASDGLRGSLVFGSGEDMPLDRMRVVAQGLQAAGETGWRMTANRAVVAVEPAGPVPNAFHVGLNAEGVVPGPQLRAEIGPMAENLPEAAERARVDAVLAFDGPWDRAAVEGAPPRLTSIDVASAEASWGDLAMEASGTLDVDPDGRPQGEIALRVEGWREMLAGLKASGAMPATMVSAVEAGLEFMAEGGAVEAPLRFQDGKMSLGLIPLGPAPRLAAAR